MDLQRAVWTSNLVTIKSLRVLKDKLVGQKLLGTYSNKNHRQYADNLPKTDRRLSEKHFNFFAIMFLFDSHKSGLRVIFHQFLENFRTTLCSIRKILGP